MKADQRFLDEVTTRVAALEGRTDAEIVVVAAAAADRWRDRSEQVAAVASLGLGALLLFLPINLHPAGFLADVAIGWFLLRLLARRPEVLRWTTRAGERRERAEQAARNAFVVEAVHGTPNRSGVLVYLATLEREVVLLPDLGVQGAVPMGELSAARDAFRHDDLDHFLAGLDALGAVLERHVPWTPTSDDVNLPNTPRVYA